MKSTQRLSELEDHAEDELDDRAVRRSVRRSSSTCASEGDRPAGREHLARVTGAPGHRAASRRVQCELRSVQGARREARVEGESEKADACAEREQVKGNEIRPAALDRQDRQQLSRSSAGRARRYPRPAPTGKIGAPQRENTPPTTRAGDVARSATQVWIEECQARSRKPEMESWSCGEATGASGRRLTKL